MTCAAGYRNIFEVFVSFKAFVGGDVSDVCSSGRSPKQPRFDLKYEVLQLSSL